MMKIQNFILFLGLILFSTGCFEDDETETPDNPLETLDQQLLLNLVNAQRTAGCNCGGIDMPAVNTVTWNAQLQEAAEIHSQDMANNDHFDHTGTDGSSAGDRLDRVGYNWSTYGENIGWNYANEEAMIQGWLDSPGHCKNIMNADVSEMGVAKAGDYWTQVFAN